ncbi:MAG: glycerophosphodiester phosphodiesterase [Rhizobiaceae bacterium]|nr:glycerophosphodiester phosphodiesterase [Rhizobiaceae bacterium]MCV0405209.1 glycerophosphodiester phosphodiesterase [Rhizobiaceae bacterium]
MTPDIAWIAERPIAHRGYHDLNKARWENTLSAFDAAVERGYAIECDVHLTADGEVVVFHDHDLKRLTGREGLVWQKRAAEMTALAVGGTDQQVPTLTRMLEVVAGRVPLVVELKGIPGHDEGLVGKVADLLRRYGGKAAIMSFDHWLVRQFPVAAKGIPAGLTAWGLKPHEIEAHFSMLANGISFTSYGVDQLDNAFVAFLRERLGLPVITWTVRDQAGIEKTFARADQMTFEGFEPDPAHFRIAQK